MVHWSIFIVNIIFLQQIRKMKGMVIDMKLVRNQKGFTLIELLVSIFILGLMVGPFLYVFVFSSKANITTERVTTATYIANQKMEYLYGLSQDSNTMLFEGTKEKLVTDGYVLINDPAVNPNLFIFTKGDTDYMEEIEITTSYVYHKLDKVIVKIYYKNATSPTAQIENLMEWD